MKRKIITEQPDGIIITISQNLLKERGARNWLKDYFDAMDRENYTYWMRLGTIPKIEVLYIYLVIGNKVKYRSKFVCFKHGSTETFENGKTITAKAWVVICGPIVKAPHEIPMKGFRGFRYTEKLF
jgi:hypothetical protein